MLHKITLTKEGLHFKRNGVILHGNIEVGTYRKEDVWEEHGGRRDKSGNLLVHYIYWLNFGTKLGTKLIMAYTLNDARDILEGRVVEVDLKY